SLHVLAEKPRGLVLVTGPTGSGKSTTLAALIDEINRNRSEHILTIEDPIEFLHRHKRCIVNQREIGPDATSFADALRAALRQDPDVILVGEMRDLETIATALTAAETGHLVFATLHTQSAPSTIDRVIDVFPAEQQGQVRVQLASTLQGVVTQNLLPTADGRGRTPALEILVPDDGVRNLIRQAKIEQIYSVMQTSTSRGMLTMEQSLADLVQLARRPLDPGIVVGGEARDIDALAAALRELFDAHELPRRGVRLGVATNRIGVRTIELNGIADERQLQNAVRFRAHEALSIPLEDAVLDYHVVAETADDSGGTSRRVVLAAAYRDPIDRLLAACNQAGISVAGVDLEAFALLRAVAPPTDGDEPAAVVAVTIGHDRTTLAVSDGAVCEFTRVLEWGGASLVAAVERDCGVDASEAARLTHAVSLDPAGATD